MLEKLKFWKNMQEKDKKRLLWTVVVVLAVIVAAVVIYESAFAPKSSYSFDLSSLSGWKTYNYQAEHASNKNASTISVVTDEERGKVVLIKSEEGNDARIYRAIAVKPLSYYKVTLTYKTVNVEDGAGLNVSGYNMFGTAFSKTGTSDGWVTSSVYLETQEGQKSLDISLGLGGYGSESTGEAYFGGFSLEKVSTIPDGTVTLKLTPTSSSSETTSNEVSIWFKLIFYAVVLGALVYCVFICVRSDKKNYELRKSCSLEVGKFEKMDVVIVIIMTIITAIFSFWNLGSFEGTPNNYWKAGASGEYVEVSFKEEKTVSKIAFYSGIPGSSGKVTIQYLGSDGEFYDSSSISKDDLNFYKWSTKDCSFTTKTVRVYVNQAGLWLNEVGFYETVDDELVQIEIDESTISASYEETEDSGKAEYLFDEQDDVRSQRTLMDSTYFDEIYFPRTAYEQIHGLSIYERTHPPLGKIFMQLGIEIFGMNTFGWRFSGTLFGVMLVPLLYAFGLKVFKKRFWAFSTAFLVMFDFMRLAQTRLATIDSYSCFFAICMFYFMYDYFAVRSYEIGVKKSLVPLVFSGIMFGLGAASKWTCIYTGAGLALTFFLIKLTEINDVKNGRASRIINDKNGRRVEHLDMSDYIYKNFIPTCLWCVLLFVIIPGTIYVLSYIPYMPSNPGKSLLDIVIANQKYMYNYHSGLTATHSYGSKWYTWPIMVRPIWYYVGYDVPEGMRSTIVSMGNPAIWWLGVPAFFAGSYLAFKNNDKKMSVFVIAYLVQYAPWILINRVCFIYHYFTASVFVIFFIVYVMKDMLEKNVIKKWVIYVYFAIVVILFIMYYPVLTGLAVPTKYTEALRLFSSWYF